jgi:hypothetical protein
VLLLGDRDEGPKSGDRGLITLIGHTDQCSGKDHLSFKVWFRQDGGSGILD